MIPLGLIEQALKLIIMLIEGIPPEQRRATAIAWFWMWWPMTKLWLSNDQQQQIESIMKQS